jgi:hypothetical protein
MRRGLERRLDAYRDGALTTAERERLAQRLAADPASAERVRSTEQLGQAVRLSWTEGPPSPSPDYLIAALRPELRRVDAELGRAGRLIGFAERLVEELRALLPSPALGAAALAGLLMLFTFPSLVEPPHQALPASSLTNFSVPETATIYDLAQDEMSLMILQDEDGAAVIWILEQPEQLFEAPVVDGWA